MSTVGLREADIPNFCVSEGKVWLCVCGGYISCLFKCDRIITEQKIKSIIPFSLPLCVFLRVVDYNDLLNWFHSQIIHTVGGWVVFVC